MIAAHICVSGIVQGVGFRWFVRREAEHLGLVGTVRNLLDGRVEIRTEGDRNIIETLVDILKNGDGICRVERCEIEWNDPEDTYENFKILFA